MLTIIVLVQLIQSSIPHYTYGFTMGNQVNKKYVNTDCKREFIHAWLRVISQTSTPVFNGRKLK